MEFSMMLYLLDPSGGGYSSMASQMYCDVCT